MKINISRIFSYLVIAVFITGCQKETSQPLPETEKSIAKLPIEKQYAYVRENLKAVAAGLAPLFKDPAFIEYLHTEVAKKFDGDNNVLIKTIFENPIYGQRINNSKVQTALNAFKGLDGENWYPQIYIPFFDKHQANRKNRAARTELLEGTEVVIYDGNETVTTVPIYIYNAQDSLLETSDLANETYANENELFVISLNETVNPDGNPPPPIPNSPNGTQALVNFRIKDLTVKDGKESWIAGASEVHMKASGTTWSHILAGNTSGPRVVIPPNLHYYSQTSYKGDEIRKIPRGEIGYPIFNINYPMNINWAVDNYFVDPIVYTYVIFEYDAVPAGTKVLVSNIPSAPNPNNGYDVMTFRSSNTPYGGIPSNHSINYAIYGKVSGLPSNFQYLYYDGHHINTENIEFNTVKY